MSRWLTVVVGVGLAVAVGAARAQSIVASEMEGQQGSAGQVQAESVLTSEQMAGMPIEAREWESLGLMASGANEATAVAGFPGDGEAAVAEGRVAASSDEGGAARGLSYAGMSPVQNAEMVDGLSMEQNYRAGARGSVMGGPVSGASYGQGAVRAYRVLPATYSAEYGGAAGAVLALTTRSGSGKVHAGMFATVRSSAMAAANPFSVATSYRDGVVTSSVVKPEDTLVLFGGHVDVPLGKFVPLQRLKGKVLVFASVEGQVRDDPAISSPASAGFYALSAPQVALLGNRGVTAAETNAALDYLDGLSGVVARSSWRVLAFGRVDVKDWGREHVAMTYARNRFDSPAGSGYGSASDAVISSGRGSVGESLIHVDAFAAHWLHTFSPRWQQELRFQVVRDLEFDVAGMPLAQEPGIGPGGFAPQVSISPNGFVYGTPAGLGRVAAPDERRVQMADSMERMWGKHLVRVGFDWSRIEDRIASVANPDGTFVYDSGVTGGHAGGLVDWITDYALGVNAYPSGGCPNVNAQPHYFCFRSFSQGFGEGQTEFVTHTLAGYAEDAWRLKPGLMVSLGVRYEYTLLPLPQMPNEALDEALEGLAMPVTGLTSRFPEDRNNVGPRVSVGWSPLKGKAGTWRAGYGLFYGKLPGATVKAALTDTDLAGSVMQVRIRPTTVTPCPQVSGVGFGFPCDYVTAPPAAAAVTSSAMLFANGFRMPLVQRASLSGQLEIGRHGMVRAEYAMAVSTQLPGSVDVNVAASTAMGRFALQGGDGYPGLRSGETLVVPLYSARRLTQYGPVTALVSNVNATYHAGTIEAAMRGWKGIEVRGSFTFSRAIDYAPQMSATPVGDGQFDPYSNGYDKGLSTLEFPERFSGDAVYRWRKWRASAIATAGSGAPYSYEISGGTYLSGGRETINGSGGATYLPTVGRNTLRLPARASVDLRVEREIGLRRWKMTGYAEAFNLLNQRNLSRVETRAFLVGTPVVVNGASGPTPLVFQDAGTIAGEGLSTPAFGAATSSTTGVSRERQVEVGARIEF